MRFVEGPFGGGLIANEETELNGGQADLEVASNLAVLEAGGAQTDPVMVGHLLDENLLGGRGGLVLGDEVIEQQVELGRIFALHEAGAGSEAVREAVAGRFSLAFFGFRSGGLLRIRLIGIDLGFSGHGVKCSFGWYWMGMAREPDPRGRAQRSRPNFTVANRFPKSIGGLRKAFIAKEI